jgi:hypothetical protein
MKRFLHFALVAVICLSLIQFGVPAVAMSPVGPVESPNVPSVADVDICPNTINMASHGKYIQAFLELPEGLSVADIDFNSIRLEEFIPAEPGMATIGDHDNDGRLDLKVKFSRAALREEVGSGRTVLAVDFRLLNGVAFRGMELVKIK